jgi:hypothetical protein
MGDVNRVPPHGPRPEPDPVVALADTQLQGLRARLDELAATVVQLEPPDRRSPVEAVIAAIDHNLDEIARRLYARGTER